MKSKSIVLLLIMTLSGCGFLIKKKAVNMAGHFTAAITDNNDPETVAAALPAYLLMLEGLLKNDPGNQSFLRAAATLTCTYAQAFANDQHQKSVLTTKALSWSIQSFCGSCTLQKIPFKDFESLVTTNKDIDGLYTLGMAWAAWIQVHKKDWDAIAQIARIEIIMEQVLKLDENYEDGSAHLYLGMLTSILPKALGGKPEIGRAHFERALEISQGRNLMILVLFAEQYARLVFDRHLHDRLLKQVLNTDVNVPGYVLSNILAQRRANKLLQSADDYF